MDATEIERAALVALLCRRTTGWSETAHEVQEAGSAVGFVQRHLHEPGTLSGTGSADEEIAAAQAQIAV